MVVVELPAQLNRTGGRGQPPHPPIIERMENDSFLQVVLASRQIICRSRAAIYTTRQPQAGQGVPANYPIITASLGIQAVHQSYAGHVPLSLTPDFVWYCIVHETAEHARQNIDLYGRLLYKKVKPQEIYLGNTLLELSEVQWGGVLTLIRQRLRSWFTEKASRLFLVTFSTTKKESELAQLVALVNATSPYYDYSVSSLCGIPRIKLEGVRQDWQLLRTRAELLAAEFAGLRGYFDDLLPVLDQMVAVAAEQKPNRDFWQSFYRYQKGSGNYYVSGWVTALFAHTPTPMAGLVLKQNFNWQRQLEAGGFKINEFPSHINRVAFQWKTVGNTLQNLCLAAGVTGIDYADGFLVPRLGWAVAATRS